MIVSAKTMSLHPRQKVTCGLFVLHILQNLSPSDILHWTTLSLPYMYCHFQITMHKPFLNLQFACKIALTSNYQVHNASKRLEGQSEEMFFNSFAQIVQSQATIYLQD
jgi:hypothetical protein